MDFSPKYILSNYFDNTKQINYYYDYFFRSGIWSTLDNGDRRFSDLISIFDKKEIDDKSQVIDFLQTWYKHKWERKEMTQIIKELKNKGYTIHLCSNAASDLHDYIEGYEFFQFFDSITISADHKTSKPYPEIYEIILRENQLTAEDCLFIDDLSENIDAAEKIGIDGYHYNGNEVMFRKFLTHLKIL